jgi:hypothetical protein
MTRVTVPPVRRNGDSPDSPSHGTVQVGAESKIGSGVATDGVVVEQKSGRGLIEAMTWRGWQSRGQGAHLSYQLEEASQTSWTRTGKTKKHVELIHVGQNAMATNSNG